ncbi:sulfatase-like hydrolase/transferase [Micromonospora sp. WMMD1102]|uniref:sulfatase-like hydrolase/transferase n=1 Tax=Micromonospora sp. WMMD1102 TaxID=3016105 RepID=UPI00241578C8|nr:sulfatase-like hydrolase/transferase [Micromonospora sp. WMMD1102]MDG4789139.1 sulfatase-like hydrolase/transferase [Micromonospora sp. WMMD1102]
MSARPWPGFSTLPAADRAQRTGGKPRAQGAIPPHCAGTTENGVLGLTHARFGWDLLPGERHLARLLKEQGYATSLVGVQHESRVLPDEAVAGRLGFDDVRTGGRGEVVADRAIDRLARFAEVDRPFYLQVGFREPHRLPGHRDPWASWASSATTCRRTTSAGSPCPAISSTTRARGRNSRNSRAR